MNRWGVFKIVTAIFAALALVPAVAQADPVDGGNVHLKLTAALTRAFAQDGVRLVGLGPAQAGKQGVTLPISEGLLEQRHGSGYLFLDGGFRLRAGKRSLTVKKLVLDINGHALRGKVNGTAMKIAEPSPQQATVDGFDLDLSLGALKLTGRAAGTLNRKLGLHGVFGAGRSLASVSAVAGFEFLGVRGGEVIFTIEEDFRKKLASVEAFVGASGSATLRNTAPVVVAMPLEGGQVAPGGSSGVLLSQGGLSFAQHGEPFDHMLASSTRTSASNRTSSPVTPTTTRIRGRSPSAGRSPRWVPRTSPARAAAIRRPAWSVPRRFRRPCTPTSRRC